jgi:hypothetical protein
MLATTSNNHIVKYQGFCFQMKYESKKNSFWGFEKNSGTGHFKNVQNGFWLLSFEKCPSKK